MDSPSCDMLSVYLFLDYFYVQGMAWVTIHWQDWTRVRKIATRERCRCNT